MYNGVYGDDAILHIMSPCALLNSAHGDIIVFLHCDA